MDSQDPAGMRPSSVPPRVLTRAAGSHVVVFGAHCPARTAARVGPAPGQRRVARLRRSGRTALVRRTARRSTALSRWRYKIAPGREAAAPGRPLRRPAHGGGGDSRVGDVVVFGAHCPARTAARVLGPVPGQRKVAQYACTATLASLEHPCRWWASNTAARMSAKDVPGLAAMITVVAEQTAATSGVRSWWCV